MNNTRYEDFCNRMRVYRKRLGYNQADIGKELGISQNDYSKRENGLIMISYDNLKKLQEIGMDIDELVSGKRDDIDTKDLDELISDCESEELKDMTMRMVAECIKYYRVNDTKNKDNDTQNDRMFDFMLKQWDDFSMLEYVRHETHYSHYCQNSFQILQFQKSLFIKQCITLLLQILIVIHYLLYANVFTLT